MDCDSTGIEPLFALKSYKQLSGGGTMEIIPDCVKHSVNNLREIDVFSDMSAKDIIASKKDIFATANEISPEGHIEMMAACQPFLNGAISKTINISNDSTVEDVMDIYQKAYDLGLKAVAIYRDGSKALQPLTTKKQEIIVEDTEEEEAWVAYRRKLPETADSIRHKFDVCGLDGYVIVGLYDDGRPGEMWIKTKNQGTFTNEILDCFAIAISYCLQFGVPPETLAKKFIGSRFEPAGYTGREDIPIATSILDYIFKWFKQTFLDEEETTEEIETIELPEPKKLSFDGPPCLNCGAITCRSGKCYVCPTCGTGGGCEG
jgi:ribonucleoside-diphosphate reductase alpha chain